MTFNKFYSDLHIKTKTKIQEHTDNHITKDGKLYTLDGEYIGDKYQSDFKVKYSDNQLDKFKSMNDMYEHEKENGGFIFLFFQLLKSMDEQLPNLTKPDIARLLYLTTYVQFDTNKILYDNGRQIPDKELAKMLKLQPRQYKDYIKKLIDNDYMVVNDEYKILSPYLCKYGAIDIKWAKKNTVHYTRLFKGTVRRIFEAATSRELNKISVLYLVLPYVSLNYSIVCHNPLETDHDKVRPMSITQLSDVLGYKDSTSLRKQLYTVKIDKQNVFSFWSDDKDKRKTKVILNPKAVYGGDSEHLKTLSVYFNSID